MSLPNSPKIPLANIYIPMAIYTLLLSCLDKEENVYRRMSKERHLLGGKGMLIFCCQIC